MRWRTAHRRRRRVEAHRQRRERLAQTTALQRQFYNLGRNIRVSVQGMGYLRKALEEAAVRIRETMPRLIEEALRKNARFCNPAPYPVSRCECCEEPDTETGQLCDGCDCCQECCNCTSSDCDCDACEERRGG